MAAKYNGYFKSNKDITKNDIITLCNLLNNNPYYTGLCQFTPERISEGGIKFNFINEPLFCKTVRLCVSSGAAGGKWPWINDNVMTDWIGNGDIILGINKIIHIKHKTSLEAPLFTKIELRIWEECFSQVGLIKARKNSR
jgi:hypothetical protein